MPAKNIIKIYIENGYYHLYNRGVEKRVIFLDERDYKTFLHFLKVYLSPPPPNGISFPLTGSNPVRLRPIQTVHGEIILLAHCLMPTHFHLLVKQKTKDAITKLMRRVCTNYVTYFNKRYERTGSLFQGNYKAVLVKSNEQLFHLSRYIHINPKNILEPGAHLLTYPYSSYADYLNKRKTNWIHPEEILSFFKTNQDISHKNSLSYQSFVEEYLEESEEILKGLTLE